MSASSSEKDPALGRHGNSPLFKTPAKSSVLAQLYRLNHTPNNGLNHKNPYNESSPMKCAPDQESTPQNNSTPFKVSTPLGETLNYTEELSSTVSNPFENFMLSRLHLPTFSPSVFSKMSTPSSDEKSSKGFRWSIDQLAILHPVDIDEMSEQPIEVHDEETEGHVQKTIDKFFSSQLIAPSPSPWSQSQSKASSAMSTNCSIIIESASDNPAPVAKTSCSPSAGVKDVGCQTMLTLPMNFDLQKVLGEFFTGTDDCNTDSLSTSTLRRKLFCQGDTESVPTSPVKIKEHPLGVLSCDQSPKSCFSPPLFATPEQRRAVVKTAQFSSSPIVCPKSSCGSNRSYISPGRDQLTSPELSPIVSSRLKTPASGSSIHSGPFAIPLTPSCYPLQATPSSGRQTMPLVSPNMSPINLDSSQVSEKSGRTSLVQALKFTDEYPLTNREIETSHAVTSSHCSPFAYHGHKELSPERSSTPTEESAVSGQQINTNRLFLESVHGNKGSDHHVFHHSAMFGAAQLSAIRENQSTMDMDTAHSSGHHDTGYQTCSMQTTHQDTKSHSSLANHDAHSMQNATNQDFAMSLSDQMSIHSDLTDQINYLPVPSNDTGIDMSVNSNALHICEVTNYDKENIQPTTDEDRHDDRLALLTKTNIEHKLTNCFPLSENVQKRVSTDFHQRKGCDIGHNMLEYNPLFPSCVQGQMTSNFSCEGHDVCSTEKNAPVSLNSGNADSQNFPWDPIGSSTPSRRHLSQIPLSAQSPTQQCSSSRQSTDQLGADCNYHHIEFMQH